MSWAIYGTAKSEAQIFTVGLSLIPSLGLCAFLLQLHALSSHTGWIFEFSKLRLARSDGCLLGSLQLRKWIYPMLFNSFLLFIVQFLDDDVLTVLERFDRCNRSLALIVVNLVKKRLFGLLNLVHDTNQKLWAVRSIGRADLAILVYLSIPLAFEIRITWLERFAWWGVNFGAADCDSEGHLVQLCFTLVPRIHQLDVLARRVTFS